MRTGTTAALVTCRGLTKAYGDGETRTIALRGVDLSIHAGELLMLVGPSGCGKTTLISIIAGTLDADGGTCSVLERELLAMNPYQRALFRQTGLGFVFQDFNLLPALTATENVSIPLLLQGMKRAQAEQQARLYLASVGLGHRTEARPAHLSGGQQQRVAIARALVHKPPLIICDEPTSNLDHASGQRVLEILRTVGQDPHRAIIVVTHDPRIHAYADTLAHMDDGRIVAIESRHTGRHS